MVFASGVAKTIFSSSDPNELCDKLELLLQQKQAGNNSIMFDQEIFAIIGNFLEKKCISTKKHKQLLIRYNLLHTKKK